MKQDISSLMDGELDPHDADRIMKACCADQGHKDTWNVYHAIGEAIRGQCPRSLDRPARVMEAVSREPTVIGGPRRNLFETTLGRVALAAAASVATIGVVSWIGTQGGAPGAPAPLMANGGTAASSIKPVANTATVPAVPANVDVQEYLTAHRQIPSPDGYRPVANQAPAGVR
jgi:sigma-E factor negative regulatory protein RseA